MVNILEQVEQTKFCGPCSTRKPLSSFHKSSHRCKECASAYYKSKRVKPEFMASERKRDRVRQSSEQSKAYHRRHALKVRCGTTPEAVDEAKRLQNNRCKVCRRILTKSGSTKACVDHCHNTKHLRAVLCQRCNFVEGLLGSVKVARQMLEFMEQNEFLSYND